MRVAVDTGGTFTDLIGTGHGSDAIVIVKVPSTPRVPGEAVLSAMQQLGSPLSDLERVTIGSTIGLNALLQRNGAQVIFVTTAGFEDIPHIQRISRPHAYDLQWVKSQPFVERAMTIGVVERMDHLGQVVTALEHEEVRRVLNQVGVLVAKAERPAIAISLLFSYANPAHERSLAEALASEFPNISVSVSSQVAPVWREHERASTTIADAYVKPIISGYAEFLDRGLRASGVTAPIAMMRSNGGQSLIQHAADHSAQLILSGLAGGLLAGKYYADLLARPDLVTLDMGGTSADVGLISGGHLTLRESYDIEFSLPIAGSFVDMTTIGAGGSSIVGFDRGGLLAVGPESAGADPGPAAYGRGGLEATVTDANLILGRLDPNFFLGGRVPLHVDLATQAVARVAERLQSTLDDAALAIIRLADENMANAVRLLTVDRGLDHRAFDLLAFGGAGPVHAAGLAEALGMSRVIIPLHPGLTSAFGLLVATPRIDRRLTRGLNTAESTSPNGIVSELAAGFGELVDGAVTEIRAEGYDGPVVVSRTVSMRYLGQNYEQEVALLDGEIDEAAIGALVDGYHSQHESYYGYAMRDNICELIHLNVTALGVTSPPSLPDIGRQSAPEPLGRRPVRFRGAGWLETPIYLRAALPAQFELVGPAVIQELDSTTVVHPNQHLSVDGHGVMFLKLNGGMA